MIQTIIAGIIVVAALYFTARHIIKMINDAKNGKSGCDCCSTNGSCKSFKENGEC